MNAGHDAGMGSIKKPKDPPPPPPPMSSTGADIAQEVAAAKKREKKRYDFSKTIYGQGRASTMGATSTGGVETKQTLG